MEKWGKVDTPGCIQRLLSRPGRLDSLQGIAIIFGKEVTSISRFRFQGSLDSLRQQASSRAVSTTRHCLSCSRSATSQRPLVTSALSILAPPSLSLRPPPLPGRCMTAWQAGITAASPAQPTQIVHHRTSERQTKLEVVSLEVSRTTMSNSQSSATPEELGQYGSRRHEQGDTSC